MPEGVEHPWLIAVHGGAGYHSTDVVSENAVKHALRSACTSAIEILRNENKKSIDAVEHAICVLEDDQSLNAGYGSNLTIDGTVECDASIMDGVSHDFGSVGAVQGVKNPITLARVIMHNSAKAQPLGRVPPLTLVGPGAQAFAKSSVLQLVDADALISGNARREWEKWRTRFESASNSSNEISGVEDTRSIANLLGTASILASTTAPEERASRSILEDTVGAVACNISGGLAAGVSSGGLLLKYPGRIGEAAVFGAGIWAHSPPGQHTGVACSVSGAGEAIIRTSFARTLAEALCAGPPEEMHNILEARLQAFCDDISARGEEPNVGVLVLTKEPIDDEEEDHESAESEFDEDSDSSPAPGDLVSRGVLQVDATVEEAGDKAPASRSRAEPDGRTKLRLWCAFTTESMAVAYASSEDDKPRAMIMRRYRTRRNTGTDPNAKKGIVNIVALPLSR